MLDNYDGSHEVVSTYYNIGGEQRAVLSDIDHSGDRIVMSASVDTLGLGVPASKTMPLASDTVDFGLGGSSVVNSDTDIVQPEKEESRAQVDTFTKKEASSDIMVKADVDDSALNQSNVNQDDVEDELKVDEEIDNIDVVVKYLSDNCDLDDDNKASLESIFAKMKLGEGSDVKDGEFRHIVLEEVGKAICPEGETVTEEHVKEFRDKLNADIDKIIDSSEKEWSAEESETDSVDSVVTEMIKDGYKPDVESPDRVDNDKSKDVLFDSSSDFDDDVEDAVEEDDDEIEEEKVRRIVDSGFGKAHKEQSDDDAQSGPLLTPNDMTSVFEKGDFDVLNSPYKLDYSNGGSSSFTDDIGENIDDDTITMSSDADVSFDKDSNSKSESVSEDMSVDEVSADEETVIDSLDSEVVNNTYEESVTFDDTVNESVVEDVSADVPDLDVDNKVVEKVSEDEVFEDINDDVVIDNKPSDDKNDEPNKSVDEPVMKRVVSDDSDCFCDKAFDVVKQHKVLFAIVGSIVSVVVIKLFRRRG